MTQILVVDDQPVFRDPVVAYLRKSGFEVRCASNGEEALSLIRTTPPDLVLLDVAMPKLDGISMLRAIRESSKTAEIPVILLTAMAEKVYVVQAAELGIKDYLLKSRFSLADLLGRVRRALQGSAKTTKQQEAKKQKGSGPTPPGPTGAPTMAAAKPMSERKPAGTPAAPDAPAATPGAIITREECLARAHDALATKSLSGVVAQVIQLATSPRTDATQVASLIARDPNLTAKLLQVGNSAVYASARGQVTNVQDVIKKIGFSAVRNIAASVGVFEAMPSSDGSGFDPIRCWQHSFAVAQLCENLAAAGKQMEPAVAYLAGLCHDLGEVLIYTRFGKEYRQVLDAHERTGRPLAELERLMLGVTHPELMKTILDCLGQPEAIRTPIETMHEAAGAMPPETPGRILFLADRYANGMLLASSGRSPLEGLTQEEYRQATGVPKPPATRRDQLRAEIFALTGLLARTDDVRLRETLFPLSGKKKKIVLARDGGLSAFDPIEAVLEMLGEVVVQDSLAGATSADDVAALVVAARTTSTSGFSGDDIAKALKSREVPTFWVVGSKPKDGATWSENLQPVQWPVALDVVAKFVGEI